MTCAYEIDKFNLSCRKMLRAKNGQPKDGNYVRKAFFSSVLKNKNEGEFYGTVTTCPKTVKKIYVFSDNTALPFKISNSFRRENKGVSILQYVLFCNESGICCFSRNKFMNFVEC